MLSVQKLYDMFLIHYGPQNWWPLIDLNQGKSRYLGNKRLEDNERLEIILGAILTQNISWTNVEKALLVLKRENMIDAKTLHKAEDSSIASMIRPTGYYNQKTKKIKNFLNWLSQFDYSFDNILFLDTTALRAQLLGINGIGAETADTILLYALNRKSFVIDAYTRRILSRMGIIYGKNDYDSLQLLFHEDFHASINDYKEFHALFVEHCKRACLKKPGCGICFLSLYCKKNLLD